MAAGPSLGAEWVASHGQGRLASDQREELRSELLRDIQARGGYGGDKAAQVKNEVDLFLRNGRVSQSNLRRLERRVFQLAGEGSLSARGEVSRPISEYSQTFSTWQGTPQSARQQQHHQSNPEAARPISEHAQTASTRQGPPPSARQQQQKHSKTELDELLRSIAPGGIADMQGRGSLAQTLPAVPEAVAQKLGKWSEVAKYAKLAEDKEKEQKREARKQMQLQMRRDLQLQIQEKKLLKQRVEAEEMEHFKNQEAELDRWKQTQDAVREEAKNKALKVNKEREEQSSRINQMRESEKEKKREEDEMLVQKAARDLDKEAKMRYDTKMKKMAQQQKMVAEMKEEGRLKEELKKAQAEEDMRKVKEYHTMVEDREARNRTNNVARTVPEPPPPAKPGCDRGREVYSDENLMQQLKDRNSRAEEAEQQRMERVKSDRQTNQDYLFQQIEERAKQRRQAAEQKGTAKTVAQEADRTYVEAERRRIEEQRAKNTQYRLELEQQISAKKAGQLPRQAEDQMSKAERAINRRLLHEVVELHSEVGSPGKRKQVQIVDLQPDVMST